jgi:predicted TIM-barrel fold metal-dependent hydrolase
MIDAHAHVWALDSAVYPWRPSFGYVPRAAAPPDVLLEAMEAAGVEHAILVQPSVYGSDHRFLLETVRTHPSRFLPVGLVDPSDSGAGDAAVALVDAGCIGLRINFSLDLQEGTAQATGAAWTEFEELEVPICVRATAAHHDLVKDVLARNPRLILIVDHLGLPDVDRVADGVERIAELACFPHCRLKIAGLARLSSENPPYRDLWPLVQAALECFGSSRLLWGSDFPGAEQNGNYVDEVRAMEMMPFMDAADRDRMMAGTSRELWGTPPARVMS